MSLTADDIDIADFFEGIRTMDYADRTDAVVEAFVSNACVGAWHKHRHTESRYPLGDGGHYTTEDTQHTEVFDRMNRICRIEEMGFPR